MESLPHTIVIVGATSAMAMHCARLWLLQGPARLVLIGRDGERTERVAADLRVRSPASQIHTLAGDLVSPASVADLTAAALAHGTPQTVLIAHGSLPDQASCARDPAALATALAVNASSPVLFAEAFASAMERAGAGTLGIIGSVAGDRGRKSNYIYGAAKGLVTRYAQGLQHRLARTGVKVVLIKPGPTATPMTAHLQADGARMADVAEVAQAIVRGMRQGRPVVYAPARWALIMMVIRHLPRFVFNKMDI